MQIQLCCIHERFYCILEKDLIYQSDALWIKQFKTSIIVSLFHRCSMWTIRLFSLTLVKKVLILCVSDIQLIMHILLLLFLVFVPIQFKDEYVICTCLSLVLDITMNTFILSVPQTIMKQQAFSVPHLRTTNYNHFSRTINSAHKDNDKLTKPIFEISNRHAYHCTAH